ncbi:hypothetical protein SAY86_017671 [Trapa natans]|uniref:Protein PHYTOCHROME KINASE SUBSTRATE 1-like n=1 Tax=Trapa natans TaxID=22666 RepID=A0AAN7R5A0_TRANT|nr:hypothetical protein SAY86_017671 [Trapa natans]
MANLIQSTNSDPSHPDSFNSAKFCDYHARNLSFSSYLNPREEGFIHKLVLPGKRSLSFNAEPEVDRPYYLECKVQDSEIEVFDAEKYFNGEIDCEDKKDERESELESNTTIELVRPRVNKMGTPSVGSELSSSMNSQSALLRNIVGNLSQKRIRKVYGGRSLLALMSCSRCSCSGKGSVDVIDDGNTTTTKFSSSVNAESSADCVSSIHNISLTSDRMVTEEIQTHMSRTRAGDFVQMTCSELSSLKLDREEERRKSLEVFGSPLFGKEVNSKLTFNSERRQTMLDTSTKEDTSEVLNETGSDASSDLFEIESLTGKVSSYLTRQTSDATSGCLTPSRGRYAQSEASIDWSVVTTSAAEFSALSDYEEVTSGKLTAAKCSGQAKNGSREAPERRLRAGILLGCSSQKAVQVAGGAHKVTYGSSDRRSDLTSNHVVRFQADAKYGKISPHQQMKKNSLGMP